MVNNLKVYGVSHINDVINFFKDETKLSPVEINAKKNFISRNTTLNLISVMLKDRKILSGLLRWLQQAVTMLS